MREELEKRKETKKTEMDRKIPSRKRGEKMKKKLVFLGPPGAGKGTYASRVEKRLGHKQIATGDILREEVKKETELGKKAKTYMDKGELVPDEIMIDILEKKLEEPEIQEKGYVLDGFPRTLPQAKALDEKEDLDLVVNLNVPEEIIVKRLSSRIICKECGEVYNKLTLPPEEEGVCDECGGELYQREDDRPEAIKERLKVYKKQTKPLIEHYKEKGILENVKCDEIDIPPEVMVDKIVKIIKD